MQRIALVPFNQGEVPLDELMRVAAAIDKQVQRDWRPIWGGVLGAAASVSVSPFARLAEAVANGAWPVIIGSNVKGASGFHSDDLGQPFALVQLGPNWEHVVSHEVLELLVDPFGNLFLDSDAIDGSGGRSSFLVEICDPCESIEFSYTVDGIVVSDFYTPNYFDPVQSSGVRYSFQGSITEPKQVLKGGYLSWRNPITNEWQQRTFFSGNVPVDHSLGQLSAVNGSIRSQIDKRTVTSQAKSHVNRAVKESKKKQSAYQKQALARTKRLMQLINQLMADPNTKSANGSAKRPRKRKRNLRQP